MERSARSHFRYCVARQSITSFGSCSFDEPLEDLPKHSPLVGQACNLPFSNHK